MSQNEQTRLTEAVVSSIGHETDPRLKEIITALVRHSHAFVREVNLTTDEFMAGLRFMNWAGQMTTEKRNEGLLLSDVLGLERCVATSSNPLSGFDPNALTGTKPRGPDHPSAGTSL